ncbi:GMC oxidoreductase [Effusibacillus consociatus]|uniref:GMC oxidoreductase n=1 Tax=Effusibacillus consociatus TaxID=1117041 RepID=A0ABV9Q7Q9_9BACL
MYFYFGRDGETLRFISQKYHLELKDLLAFNPHIQSPDLIIAGRKINIPSTAVPLRQTVLPPCPPEEPPDYLDHWIPLTSLEKMQQTDYDVLIVGSGAGGGAVLWRLCERWGRNGKRIGMVEAGDLLLPTHARNIPTMSNRRLENYLLSPKVSKPLPQFPGAKQIFALGGRTLFWGAFSPRMYDAEMQKWPIPVEEIRFYYNIAEQIMNVTSAYTKGSSITQLLLQRLRENGFPEAMDVPMAVDLESTQYGQIHSNVFFSSFHLLASSLNLRPFDLAVKARAVQVLTDRGKAVGVKVMSPDKRSYVIKAKTIVLSASTFETPRLLLYSGIRGPAIGRYLVNHSFVRAKGMISRQEFPEVLGTLKILIPQTEARPFQIEIHGPGTFDWYQPFEQKPLREQWEIILYGFGKVEPRFENRVYLDPRRRDEYGVPEIQIDFAYSQNDKAVILHIAEGMKQTFSAMRVPFNSIGSAPICLQPVGEVFHDMGTCRMGDDPLTSATDRYGQIHGVSGLYVADSSILVTVGAANPALTTVAMALRTADHILHQLK